MRVRKLEHEDLEALVALDQKSFERAWTKAQLADELEHEVVFGAFDEAELVGAVCARVVCDEVWIFRIMALPKCRRQGVAGKLLQRVDAVAHEAGKALDLWLEVSVENHAAIAFYEKQGFEVQSR